MTLIQSFLLFDSESEDRIKPKTQSSTVCEQLLSLAFLGQLKHLLVLFNSAEKRRNISEFQVQFQQKHNAIHPLIGRQSPKHY